MGLPPRALVVTCFHNNHACNDQTCSNDPSRIQWLPQKSRTNYEGTNSANSSPDHIGRTEWECSHCC